MRSPIAKAFLFSLLSASALVPTHADANNRSVEAALSNYGDVSIFYQALVNTGVINELQPDVRYTIFAPTNEAFAAYRPDVYPCFYSVQCRPQVAEVLRNHIVVGRRSLNELAHEAEVPTIGANRVYAESPFVGEYSVASRKILSGAEINGNMIYRLDGIIVSGDQLSLFRGPRPVAEFIPMGRTVVTYHTSAVPVAEPVPGGGGDPNDVSEVVTKKTYLVPGQDAAGYPNQTQVTTTKRTYVTPEGYHAGGDERTTVTRTITTEP